MRRAIYMWSLTGVLSLTLGMASVWPVEGGGELARGVVHSLLLLVALAVFVLILPKRLTLPIQIFLAMISGVAVGWLMPHVGSVPFVSDYLGIFGTLFILLLTVVIIPLIFVSIVCGVSGIGDVRKLGALGVKTIAYYVLTTAIAVLIGLTVVNVLRPGLDRMGLLDETHAIETTEEAAPSLGSIIQTEVLPVIIQNPVMAGQDAIAIIFFAILLGAALSTLGKTGEPAIAVFQGLDRAFITIILWVMKLAPIGVFALMARAISELGIEYMLTLTKYVITVLLGLGLHFCVLVFVICPLLGRVSPRRFLRGMLPAFEVSFSTSSSAATIPVTIECASKRVGADKNICNFMLPIGATINMDGTALYVSVASLFIAQVYGIDLSLQQQLMVFLTAVMVSVGTAGIPGASIGLMSIILTSAGIPVEGIGIVVGVDRILDMSRTVINITGDSMGAVVVSQSEGVMGQPVEEY